MLPQLRRAESRLESLSLALPLLLLLVLSHVACAAPPLPADSHGQKVLHAQPISSSSAASVQPPRRKLNGRFLHITDFHPDQFYKVHSSSDKDAACHRGKGDAGIYGAETTRCDSPFALLNATVDWISDNLKDDIDFIVWTGDSARHDSDERHPRTRDEVLDSNRFLADKLTDNFSNADGRLEVPIVPTFGNNDFLPHNIFFPGPNKWLHDYDVIWNRFIPEAQRHSFEFGGWFFVEVIPKHLVVFSLNTMYFFDRNAAVDGCASPSEPGYEHMHWLSVQLQLLRERGMKAILIGHVPPARTSSKQNWDETCWQKYTLWLKQFRDVIVGSLYGHMNIDHFLIQDTEDIDISLLEAPVPGTETSRTSEDTSGQEDDMSVQSQESYLQDLRKFWSDLPGPAIESLPENAHDGVDDSAEDASRKKGHKKKNKFKKIGGKYAERYSLSLISPSVIPNFFPTIRVFDYNITGLEDAPVWTETSKDASEDSVTSDSETVDDGQEEDDYQELKRDVEVERRKKKKKKGHKKPKKPKHPNLHIPDGPPEGAMPGPAYFPQPFTLTGYTQYFANLTHINNDVKGANVDEDAADVDHGHKHHKPHEFTFQVEYNTLEDKIYKVKDLTVMNYLKLAHRMSELKKGKANSIDGWDKEDDEGSDGSDDENNDENDDDVESQQGKKKKGKKKKDEKKRKERNKVWHHFLDHAFVRTVPKDELDKM